MDNKSDVNVVPFVLEEYRDLYQNVMHIETKIFNHLTFFNTIFIGITTATIAGGQLARALSQPLPLKDILGFVTIPYFLLFLLARFSLRMTVALRIRKVKFLESLAKTRQFFIDMDSDKKLGEYILLPSSIAKVPPYLRVGSEDWYQVLYLCFFNGLSFAVAWTCFDFLFEFILNNILKISMTLDTITIVVWTVVGIFFATLVGLQIYVSSLNESQNLDKKRAKDYGASTYDLLDTPIPSAVSRWTFSNLVKYLHQTKNLKGNRK
jgi:hypothetical protein